MRVNNQLPPSIAPYMMLTADELNEQIDELTGAFFERASGSALLASAAAASNLVIMAYKAVPNRENRVALRKVVQQLIMFLDQLDMTEEIDHEILAKANASAPRRVQ